jgi:Uma2 family endonuclease
MKSAALVSVDEYLHTSYNPDCEYVDGEIQERNLGEIDHSRLQVAVVAYFYARRAELGIEVLSEVRVQVAAHRFRVPDVSVIVGRAEGRIVTRPPLIVVEILSPEDTVGRLMERVQDYSEFGVPNIWVIDPSKRSGYTASFEGLRRVDVLCASGEPQIAVELLQLFQA